MLIFDNFVNRQKADDFVKVVQANYGLNAEIYDSQEESNAVDPFPFQLEAPIVLVQRANPSTEKLIIELAKVHCGEFAGT